MLRARPGTAACVLGTHDRDDAATSRHGAFTYVPRSPAASPLFEIVRSHLLEFLADSRRSSDDAGVPAFVERELRDFLGCGSFARGFARFRCDGCQAEILVPFTCKGRGFCPSCCGRRMAERSMHLVDSVLGGLPIRQWVLTCPWRLRYAMAWDQRLCRAVLAVFVRAVLGLQRRRARRRGFRGGVGGAVTAIQRSGAALNLNVHFHGLVADGVFIPTPDGGARFVPLPPPSDEEVTKLVASVRRRIVRLARRRGVEVETGYLKTRASGAGEAADGFAEDSPLLAGISGASVAGRVATGDRAGRRVRRLRSAIDEHEDGGPGAGAAASTAAGTPSSRGPWHAQVAGFDLHAGVFVPPGDRRRLEGLARYILRPPVARGALEILPDGTVCLALRRPWRDGTCAILFTPTELIEKLAALVPKPRINLLIYHGAFAPHARIRRDAVANTRRATGAAVTTSTAGPAPAGTRGGGDRDQCDRVAPTIGLPHAAAPARGAPPTEAVLPAAPAPSSGTPNGDDARQGSAGPRARPGRFPHPSWAELLRRVWSIDVLACPACGGRLRLLATLEHPAVVRRILSHLGLPTEVPQPLPARAPPEATEQSLFPEH